MLGEKRFKHSNEEKAGVSNVLEEVGQSKDAVKKDDKISSIFFCTYETNHSHDTGVELQNHT